MVIELIVILNNCLKKLYVLYYKLIFFVMINSGLGLNMSVLILGFSVKDYFLLVLNDLILKSIEKNSYS